MSKRVELKITERDRSSGESFARAVKKFGGKVQEECVVDEARMRSRKMKPKAYAQAKQQYKIKLWKDYKWVPFPRMKRIGETN